MRLIKSDVQVMDQKPGLEGIFEAITAAGYTCYKTTKEITNEVAKEFVKKMIDSNHLAMLEHGTVYLHLSWDMHDMNDEQQMISLKFKKNPYSVVNYFREDPTTSNHEDLSIAHAYITTNYRVLVENKWIKYLSFACNPTIHHEPRYMVKFICDRGVSHELVRHRVFSFAQESTRYCNYSKDKFGNELTFIEPTWYHGAEPSVKSSFMAFLEYSERAYFELLDNPYTPQQARQVLPNALKTEIVVSGFSHDWDHFFDLRAFGKTGKPHPDMEVLAISLLDRLTIIGYTYKNN